MAETIRASLKTSLADLYNKAGSSLGFGAKGIPKASDHVDVGNKIQNQFQVRTPVGVTSYTPTSLNYATTLGINTTKYKG